MTALKTCCEEPVNRSSHAARGLSASPRQGECVATAFAGTGSESPVLGCVLGRASAAIVSAAPDVLADCTLAEAIAAPPRSAKSSRRFRAAAAGAAPGGKGAPGVMPGASGLAAATPITAAA